MPLGYCNVCRARLRLGRATCRGCGTKKKRAKLILSCVILAQLVTIGVYAKFGGGRPSGPRLIADPRDLATPAVLLEKRPPAGWVYYDTRDELIGDTTHHARVLSRSDPTAGLPGDHGTTGVLELRASPAYGRSAVISMSPEVSADVVGPCELRVQFDDGPEAAFAAAASGGTGHLMLSVADVDGFTGRLLSAQTMSVSARVLGRPRLELSFMVGGLSWR